MPKFYFFWWFILLVTSSASWAKNSTCDPQGVLYRDGYSVLNNIWGVTPKNDPVRGFSQCVTVFDDGVTRFQWSNFAQGRGKIKSYPHISVGWDWSGKFSKEGIFPLAVNVSSSLTAFFDFETSGSGTYNTSFDIWMSRLANPLEPRKDLSHEVMIWLDKKDWKIPRQRKAEVVVDGQVYDLYLDPTPYGQWQVVSFVAQIPNFRGSLNLGQFFTYLASIGVLGGNEYINGVSFGNEIGSGSGITLIKSFYIKKN